MTTTEQRTPIGFRRNGCPIYLIQGGAVDTEQQTPEQIAAAEAAATAATAAAEAAKASEPQRKETFTADEMAAVRREAAANRVKANDAETASAADKAKLAAMLKAAGIGNDDDPVKAAETANAKAAATEARLLAVQRENALGRAARNLNADEDLLTAVLLRDGSLNQLDPNAADFKTSLDALVKQAIEANPKLKATSGRAPGTSGGDFGGGPGESRQITEAQLKTMKPEAIVEAQKKGLLRNLLG